MAGPLHVAESTELMFTQIHMSTTCAHTHTDTQTHTRKRTHGDTCTHKHALTHTPTYPW